MQKIETTCDRCKAKSDKEPALRLNIWSRRDNESFDLCPECLLELIEWIKAGVS